MRDGLYLLPRILVVGLGLTLVAQVGCDSAGSDAGAGSAPADHDHADHDHGDHDHGDHDHGTHPVHGPRDGELIELGEEAYHAEWIADEEAGVVNLFILDGAVKEDVAIAARSLPVDVTVDGETQTFQLGAVREDGTEATAHFRADNKALVSLLKLAGKGTEATLTVEIDGQTYTGKFVAHEHAHGHDHDGHGH